MVGERVGDLLDGGLLLSAFCCSTFYQFMQLACDGLKLILDVVKLRLQALKVFDSGIFHLDGFRGRHVNIWYMHRLTKLVVQTAAAAHQMGMRW